MDFVGSSGGGISSGSIGGASGGAGAGSGVAFSGSDNGPILYSEPNRTSAIDDIRSVVIYIFIITIFFSYFLIFPGIRNDKFPTFLCITTSLIVTSIILISLFGTTWHVGEAQISAPYKAFSRDRIQGELSVRIGLQSVNITLRAHKYYILDATNGPIIMENAPMMGRKGFSTQPSDSSQEPRTKPPQPETMATSSTTSSPPASSGPGGALVAEQPEDDSGTSGRLNSADELLTGRGWDETAADAELEADEAFGDDPSSSSRPGNRQSRSTGVGGGGNNVSLARAKEQPRVRVARITPNGQKYTIKRVDVDINFNERFYWIGPSQMRQEHHHALERGLPYPILTVVEYLSQDDGGFSWSRKYRLAGYYSYICLWLSLCVCVLMFVLHCAAPKYGIYTMQALGCLLLFTNLTYATLVPRGEQKLVIPFEGQSLSFEFGWNFWIVLIGGCLSLTVGTIIVIIDRIFPNFIFTTVLDVDFDSHHSYYRRKQNNAIAYRDGAHSALERPIRPPFYNDDHIIRSSNASPSSSSQSSPSLRHHSGVSGMNENKLPSSSPSSQQASVVYRGKGDNEPLSIASEKLRARQRKVPSSSQDGDLANNDRYSKPNESELVSSKSSQLYLSSSSSSQIAAKTPKGRSGVFSPTTSPSENDDNMEDDYDQVPEGANGGVVVMATNVGSEFISDSSGKHHNLSNHRRHLQQQQQQQQHHYGRGQASKNASLKSTHHQAPHGGQAQGTMASAASNEVDNVRL